MPGRFKPHVAGQMGGKWGQVGHNWGSNRTQYRRQPVTTRLGLPETAIPKR